ncbi:sigma-70 family RNA polymerase sigma factor [Cytobacillus depressus]|uniref:Sigma-70 family RNA polymerase sigma factor n=1 Tax=Cytobacillus depressus TaxID=1602942 RepID=A0A6L3V494_9BACI|nr:sigma-70 family RNA polymerase sigma factor [Cytobacillus depressus]KAB2334881.1 sigma-70 family RNA polymerase sigma factor [Cytobacillus depressus]
MEYRDEYSQIIERILAGNHQAYAELYENTIQDVYKNVYFLIEEKAEAEDLVQEIYIQLYKSLGNYDRNQPFRPWLMGIMIKQIQAYRRKRWMRFRIMQKAEVNKQMMIVDFSNDIVDRMTNEHLVHLVNDLPFKLKEVIILRYLNDYSQEEVAKILEIPIGTVKSRIHSALKKLRTKGQNNKFFIEKARNA